MTALATRRLRRRMSFHKTFWNRSLRRCLPIKLVRLVLMIILNKIFGKFSFRNSAYSRTIRSSKTSLSATVPDSKLFQLHLSQLCQQDPESAISRQLPEEPCQLQDLEQQLGQQQFSQSTPASQSRSLQNRIFPTSAWKSSSQRTLANRFQTNSFRNNLSTDQRQLQNNQLQKNTFQQLSLEHPNFREKTLHKELATTFAKNSLITLSFRTSSL